MRQHVLRGRAKPPCPEAPAPKGAAVLLGQESFPARPLVYIPPCLHSPPVLKGRKRAIDHHLVARIARGWLAGWHPILQFCSDSEQPYHLSMHGSAA